MVLPTLYDAVQLNRPGFKLRVMTWRALSISFCLSMMCESKVPGKQGLTLVHFYSST